MLSLQKGSAKVKWSDVCCLGGLGIKSFAYLNVALMSKHDWNIVSGKDLLWVYRLRDKRIKRNFWDVPELCDVCWS